MSPRDALEAETWWTAPVIVGTNGAEWLTGERLGGIPRMGSRLEMQIPTQLLYPLGADDLLAHYMPDSDAEAGAAFVRMQTDGMFACRMHRFAKALTEHGRTAYVYQFDVPPAAHALELDYVFGWPSDGVATQYPGEAPVPSIPAVVDAMQRFWTQFARTGDPNVPGYPRGARTPKT